MRILTLLFFFPFLSFSQTIEKLDSATSEVLLKLEKGGVYSSDSVNIKGCQSYTFVIADITDKIINVAYIMICDGSKKGGEFKAHIKVSNGIFELTPNIDGDIPYIYGYFNESDDYLYLMYSMSKIELSNLSSKLDFTRMNKDK